MERPRPQLAVVALRNPEGESRYGFFSRTTVFGVISVVLRYNVFSRIVAELASKILGIHLVCSSDDFGSLAHGPLGRGDLDILTRSVSFYEFP